MIASDIALSIILTVNEDNAKHWGPCVDAVLAQTFPSFELLVTGGDITGDPRVRRLPAVRGETEAQSWNRLLAEARGGIVKVLRPEDRLAPEFLQELHRFFAMRPEVSFAAVKSQVVDDDDSVVATSPLGDLPEVMPSTHVLQRLFYEGCFLGSPSAVAVRRRALESVGFFDASYGAAADYELWSRLAFRGALGVLHRHLVRVRRVDEQQVATSFVDERRRIRAALLSLLPGPIQAYAREYEARRHFVADFDAAVAALAAGRAREFAGVARALGVEDLSRAALRWLLTANNRVLRPAPRYLLPRVESAPLRRAS